MTKEKQVITEAKPVQLIDLQAAHITQLTTKGIKSDWEIRKNITSEKLLSLSNKLNDDEVYKILQFAKKYELIAFNAGIKFQKDKQNEFLTAQIKDLETLIVQLRDHNDYLAQALENQSKSEE